VKRIELPFSASDIELSSDGQIMVVVYNKQVAIYDAVKYVFTPIGSLSCKQVVFQS